MKGAIFAVALLTVGCFSLPIFAQQQDLQEVMNAANALSARESELLSKKDSAGIASVFTSDGLLVMLAPQFAFKPGRDAIQKHYQGIIDAGATSIILELKNLELRGNDGVWAAGNYSVTVKDNTIQGNWFKILKRENGNWKIAMEAFARAGVIDAPPAAASSSLTPPTANRTAIYLSHDRHVHLRIPPSILRTVLVAQLTSLRFVNSGTSCLRPLS